MSRDIFWCRECIKFVSGPLATCRSCGHWHTRDRPALEEPVPFRRRVRSRANRRRQAPRPKRVFPRTF